MVTDGSRGWEGAGTGVGNEDKLWYDMCQITPTDIGHNTVFGPQLIHAGVVY